MLFRAVIKRFFVALAFVLFALLFICEIVRRDVVSPHFRGIFDPNFQLVALRFPSADQSLPAATVWRTVSYWLNICDWVLKTVAKKSLENAGKGHLFLCSQEDKIIIIQFPLATICCYSKDWGVESHKKLRKYLMLRLEIRRECSFVPSSISRPTLLREFLRRIPPSCISSSPNETGWKGFFAKIPERKCSRTFRVSSHGPDPPIWLLWATPQVSLFYLPNLASTTVGRIPAGITDTGSYRPWEFFNIEDRIFFRARALYTAKAR